MHIQSDCSKYLKSQGAPEWVTPELLADTIDTWHIYYAKPLTVEDALEILLTTSPPGI